MGPKDGKNALLTGENDLKKKPADSGTTATSTSASSATTSTATTPARTTTTSSTTTDKNKKSQRKSHNYLNSFAAADPTDLMDAVLTGSLPSIARVVSDVTANAGGKYAAAEEAASSNKDEQKKLEKKSVRFKDDVNPGTDTTKIQNTVKKTSTTPLTTVTAPVQNVVSNGTTKILDDTVTSAPTAPTATNSSSATTTTAQNTSGTQAETAKNATGHTAATNTPVSQSKSNADAKTPDNTRATTKTTPDKNISPPVNADESNTDASYGEGLVNSLKKFQEDREKYEKEKRLESIPYRISKEVGDECIIKTAGDRNNCMIHAVLGSDVNGLVTYNDANRIRRFLFDVIQKFDDDSLVGFEGGANRALEHFLFDVAADSMDDEFGVGAHDLVKRETAKKKLEALNKESRIELIKKHTKELKSRISSEGLEAVKKDYPDEVMNAYLDKLKVLDDSLNNFSVWIEKNNYEAVSAYLDKEIKGEFTFYERRNAFMVYRDLHMDPTNKQNEERLLTNCEMRLLALLTNKIIACWIPSDNRTSYEANSMGSPLYKPDPLVRSQLMEFLKDKQLSIPVDIQNKSSSVEIVHIEGDGAIHFSRFVPPKNMNFEYLDALKAKYQSLLTPSPVDESDKKDEVKKQEPKKQEPKPAPRPELDPLFGKKFDPVADIIYPAVPQTVVWTTDEKKKIYRNNINFLLQLMKQGHMDSTFKQIQDSSVNGTTTMREGSDVQYYVNLEGVNGQDVRHLLIANISAYEELKKDKPTGILTQYTAMRTALSTDKNDVDVLDALRDLQKPITRTEEKRLYVSTKLANKLGATNDVKQSLGFPLSADLTNVGFVHRKVEATPATPTHYHLKGLGNIADVANWVNTVAKDHTLDDPISKKSYRLYFHKKDEHTYEMYKREVDEKGEYKSETKLVVSKADEAKWATQIQNLFVAYGQKEGKPVINAGFKPR